MDKLKNLIKSDTPTGEDVTSGATGKITGQGSHFPGKEETSVTGTGATAPGGTLQTKGPEDVSAVPASSTAAATTAGPEQSGSDHVNTVSAKPDQPSTAHTTSAVQDTANPTEYTVASADFPKTETSSDGSGTAAVGQTSTYSSSYVGKGDPTSSVVDPQSADPLTYKKPESGAPSAETGVGAGAAAAAATLAFNNGEERKKEGMPGYENPYRAVTLDPRVDGLPKSSADASATGAGVSTASPDASQEQASAPPTLTTSVDPVDRSAEYSQSAQEKGLPESTTTAYTATTEKPAEEEPGVVGKVLGAVGLGSLAGFAGAKAVSEKDTGAVAETPEQPTTTTGIESYTAPTEQGPPTTHHRKESIPTTAYPSASFDSPRAINQPVGGAGSPVVHGDQESHTARDVGIGAATGGAAVGAAAVGAHEYEQSKAVREDISGEPQTSAPVLKEPGDTTATTGVDESQYTDSQKLRENIVSDAPASAAAPSAETAPKQEETDHTARDAAIGAGAGAAVVGAGAAGAHEYSKKEAENAEREAAKEQAAREKELAKQKAAEEKELAKEHKAAEKAAAKEEKQHQKELEKEEKKHQKEVEKEEKKQQKEAEKAEKKHQKEVEKAEKEEQHRRESAEAAALKEQRAREKEQARLEKQRAEEEEERRNREEKERLAGVIGVGGADAATDEKDKEKEKELEKEKKPSLLKRIFKRRKNKDTGEEEEYESEEEDKSHAGTAAAAGGAAVVGGGAAAYAAEHEKSTHPTTQPATDTAPSTTEATGTSTQQPAEAVTGVPSDTLTEPQTVHGTEATHSKDVAPATVESTGTSTQQPTEAITGLPYDASKDPQAAARLSEHQHGADIGSVEPTTQEKAEEKSGEYVVNTDFTLGEIKDKHSPEEGNTVEHKEDENKEGEHKEGGLGEKIKASFHMGGLDP